MKVSLVKVVVGSAVAPKEDTSTGKSQGRSWGRYVLMCDALGQMIRMLAWCFFGLQRYVYEGIRPPDYYTSTRLLYSTRLLDSTRLLYFHPTTILHPTT